MAKKKAVKSAAKTRLTTADKYYIINNPENLTHAALAKAVGCSEVTVDRTLAANGKTKKRVEKTVDKEIKEVVEEIAAESVKPNEPVDVSKLSKTQIQQMYDNSVGRARNKGKLVGAVLTPSSGELADKIRQQQVKPGLSESMKSAIHKPKG